MQKDSIQNLTDEQVLKEFVKRFQCDGAVLIYLEGDTESGFGNWRNTSGRKWVNNIFKILKSSQRTDLNILELNGRGTEISAINCINSN